MEIYAEPKDPSELKDYEFDWSAQLGNGETVVSQVVTFVDAAGTTNPTNTITTPFTRTWLAGGTHGARAVYTVKVTTSGGRELEVALGVNIVDTVTGETAPTDLENLQADLVAVETAMRKLVAGESVKEVWRDGRRIVRNSATYSDLLRHRDLLRREIEGAQAVLNGRSRRTPTALIWNN